MKPRMTPLPPCRKPGCPNLQMRGGRGYCEEHQDLADRESRRGRCRESAHRRGYTARYRKVRRRVLQEQPLCVRCLERGKVTAAEVTHHIVPLAEGGTNDPSNLMPLCRACHDREHARQ